MIMLKRLNYVNHLTVREGNAKHSSKSWHVTYLNILIYIRKKSCYILNNPLTKENEAP